MSSQSGSASELIAGMERGKSVLLGFGKEGRTLKRRIAPVGLVCRFFFFLIFNPFFRLFAGNSKKIYRRRKALTIRLARLLFPFKSMGHELEFSPCGHIFVINHPTLNDPLCAIIYALTCYPKREVVMPVNLPWFESICRYRQLLLRIGINIVPILTPSTAERLKSSKDVASIQSLLVSNYITELFQTVSKGGLVVIAQQATRQRYLFTSAEQFESGPATLSPISLILTKLRRHSDIFNDILVVPIGVIPHSSRASSSLNLFCKYQLNVGKPISAADLAAVQIPNQKRAADFHILRRLAELVPSEYHFAKIPSEI